MEGPSGRSPANDNDGPVFTLTRTQLEALVTRALQAALAQGIIGPVLIDKQDMARQLGCSPAHLDHLRKRGLPVVKVGAVIRFEPALVLDWLRAQGGE